MVSEYVNAALGKAHYEILTEDGSFYGEIPGFEGVYANAKTLEACREELREVLEEWILFQGDIGKDLLARFLRQGRIDRGEWEKA